MNYYSYDILSKFVAILLVVLKLKNVDCVICKYYPYSSEVPYNISCPDSCCNGYSSTADSACCSSAQWSSGIYIGLSVPIFCCIASVLAGFFYCCLIVKPTTHHRTRFAHFRNRAVLPREPTVATVSVKDEPPTYNELYMHSQSLDSNKPTTHANTVQHAQLTSDSPEPPPYQNSTPITNVSTSAV